VTTVATSPNFGANEADTGDLSASELYAALEDWQAQLRINGRGRNEASSHFRSIAKPEIRRIKRELRARHLPVERPDWLADAEQALADARDERETVTSALDVAVQ